MSKLGTVLKRMPMRALLGLAVIVTSIIVPATLFAWGPSRPTYTMAHPADHITFNSITDNPNIGDERNFVGIREAGTTNLWTDNVQIQEGKEYTVRMYVHNNAAENLNLVAQNVTAKFNLPTTTGKSIRVDGFLTSTNASPTEVYDDATFTSSQDFNLAYVAGSAKFENNVFGPSGVALPESIFTSRGATLGFDKLDGRIPGCLRFAGYVSFRVKPQFAPTSKFAMNKRVSKHGVNQWSKDYTAQPGETVDFMIEYRNTGEVQQDNVTFRDVLPNGMSYVNGSTVYGNSIFPSGTKASDNIANGIGINVGSYRPNANAWSIFSAKIANNDNLPQCGMNRLVNTGRVTTGGGSIESTANVNVNKVCREVPPTPPELPKTGAGENLAAFLGLGAIVTSASYYRASRRRN
jgi:uncharacterized repeat protein (TIGR01451 family)/LPXTG-motif cell wall-anchored protein